ncbi:unnamed protein product [Periconia digitata]|uniref:Uncharacterized protein n=1 Tax=Periconia digitata TaxID=1303443 RepID=A0A9W4UJC7_9PLEO|nr:unnamed protein product [Periconia digitata]
MRIYDLLHPQVSQPTSGMDYNDEIPNPFDDEQSRGYTDEKLAKIQANYYCGLARVHLRSLDFSHNLTQQKHREISKKNVDRLRNIFSRNGCLRLQEENFINATVDAESLGDAMANAKITQASLLQLRAGSDLPLLSFRHLQCLSGAHRIEAAKEFLDGNDQWWVVRLFSNNTPQPILSRVIELYSNEQKPSDGDIFRKIRLYHRERDTTSENLWWSYLDHSKPKDLSQLLNKESMASAFDSLIEIPGLWAGVRLGTLQRLLALKCDEEMIRYLKHIKWVWDAILSCGNTKLDGSVVNALTVEKLELLCPKYSQSDKKTILQLMEENVLFPSVRDAEVRRKLFMNICSSPVLIPSLRTFFETLKYLEPICEAMKQLIGKKTRGTIRQNLADSFRLPERMIVQSMENCYMELKVVPPKAIAGQLAYIQLWAFCARHFNTLTPSTPRKESNRSKPSIQGPNPVLCQRLAKFAFDLGFRTSAVERLMDDDSAQQLARGYLEKANPLCVDFTAEHIQAIVNIAQAQSQTSEVSETIDVELDVYRRCGRPYELDLADDKRDLFYTKIYSASSAERINLLFVRQDMFKSLFGEFQISESDLQPTTGPTLHLQSAIESRRPEQGAITRKRPRMDEHQSDTAVIKDLEKQLITLRNKLAASNKQCTMLHREKRGMRERLEAMERAQAGLASGVCAEGTPPEQTVEVQALNDTSRNNDEIEMADVNGSEDASTSTNVPAANLSSAVGMANEWLPLAQEKAISDGRVLQRYNENRQSRLDYEIFVVTKVEAEIIWGFSRLIKRDTPIEDLQSWINYCNQTTGGNDCLYMTKEAKWLPASSTAESILRVLEEEGTCFMGWRKNLELCVAIFDML